MNWKDLFYFSQGERRALSLLLFLLILLFIFRLWNEYVSSSLPETVSTSETVVPSKKTDSTSQTVKSTNSPPIKATPQKKEKKTVPQKKNYFSHPTKSTQKFSPGTVIELNAADTTQLKKIPGIGSVFANRIIKYRNLLGGFYTVEQLKEVYGIDEEKFQALSSWFTTDIDLIQKLPINQLSEATLRKHPYVNYKQAKTIREFVHKKGIISGWDDLKLLEEFPEPDIERLSPYFDFGKVAL